MSSRQAFLERVRQSVQEGNRAGAAALLPERVGIGYQGAADPLERFCTELTAAGGLPFVAPDAAAAWQRIHEILGARQVRKVVHGHGGLIDQLEVPARLRAEGIEAASTADIPPAAFRDTMFAADLGISNVEHMIAETGSIVIATRPDEPRGLSLLPPVHIALAHPRQILPDLFDLFDLFSPVADSAGPVLPPACLSIITGPSKTGDIELKLVTGVHGPGEVHVILVQD
jgi:L-lactate utilization protein LutC